MKPHEQEIADLENQLLSIKGLIEANKKGSDNSFSSNANSSLGRKLLQESGAMAGPIGQLATSQIFRNPETPGPMQQGGILERNLKGQLPLAGMIGGGMIGGSMAGPVGGVGGAGLGGAGGQNLQDALRQILKFDQPKTMMQNLQSAGGQGLRSAMMEAGGQMTALPFVGGANPFSSTGQEFKGLLPKTAELIAGSKLPRMLRGALESIPGLGGLMKGSRELSEEAAKTGFKGEEAARKSSYDIGANNLKEDFRIQEATRKASSLAEKRLASEGVKTLPDSTGAALRTDAGSNLSNAVKVADESLQQEVGKVVNPILIKNSATKISVEPVRQEIVNVLKANELVDANGNILRDEVNKIVAPKLKGMVSDLIQLSDNLVSNPTVKGLNGTVKQMQSLANFGSATRSAEDKVFGSLSRTAKETLYDGLEQVAGADASNAIRSARKVFSENQPIFETLRDIAVKAPEQITDTARNALPGSFIVETITKQPALKKPIGDVVLNDIARSFSSPKTFSSVLDKYGRDSLKKLFTPETWQSVLTAEKALQQSSAPFITSRAPVPIPYQKGQMPAPKLGKFWQKSLDALNAGQTLTQPAITSLFQASGKLLQQQGAQ